MLPNVDLERRIQNLERFMREIRGDRGAGAPASWTPQLYQNANITSTNNVSRYSLIGNFAIVQFRVTATAAGSAGNQIEIRNLPVTPAYASDGILVGAAFVYDNPTAFYSATAQLQPTPSLRFIGYNQTAAIGATPSFAIANGDVVQGTVIYEI